MSGDKELIPVQKPDIFKLRKLAYQSAVGHESFFQGRQSHDSGRCHAALGPDQPDADLWICHVIWRSQSEPGNTMSLGFTLDQYDCTTMIVGLTMKDVNWERD